MPDRELKTTSGLQARVPQSAVERPPGHHQTPAAQRDQTDQVVCRLGDRSCAGAHAATLNRATASHPSRAPESILRLQRQYGNRYVRGMLELAQVAQEGREPKP